MKKVLVLVAFITPLLTIAQDKGIIFEHDLTWQEILQKAKAEKKYVFLDCYASWCGPCKWMEKNVYSKDTVGDYMNKKFICIKVQMDKTGRDDEAIVKWRENAKQIEKQYQIKAYPSFLFFSPDGDAVHKDIGAQDSKGFLKMAEAALNPQRQYYTLLGQYEKGDRDYAILPYLADMAKKNTSDSLAFQIAHDYISYLDTLPDAVLFTKGNLDFIGKYKEVVGSKDRLFQRYFSRKTLVDSVMGNAGYANQLVNYLIYKEEVLARLKVSIKDSSEPNWHRMERSIKKKYGTAYVNKNILQGRVAYYHTRKHWGLYAKYLVLQLDDAGIKNWPAGPMTGLVLNNDAFEVFQYSKDKKDLKEALSWVDRALAMEEPPSPQEMDTKANLLYKLGRKSEGIALEEQSRRLAPDDKDIEIACEKMINGTPTWSE